MSNCLTAQGLTTYLLCPRKYEFEYVVELTGDKRQDEDQFRQLLRKAICTGYTEARDAGVDPHDAAVEALDAEWGVHAGAAEHHSSEQEITEKTRAQAGIEAYFDAVGTTHLDRIEQAAAICSGQVIGPNLTLRATINGHQVGANVDYIMADDSRIVGVHHRYAVGK